MTPAAPLQTIIDPFVTSAGGEVISTLISSAHPKTPSQADYLFREHRVIAELKALEQPSFGEPYRRKVGALFSGWIEQGLLAAYGTVRIDIGRLHPSFQEQWLAILAAPVQSVFAKANRQIKSTKDFLGMSDARGLLWVASDGNTDLQPRDVWLLLNRILRKTRPNGCSQYSHIDGIVYFNPRFPVQLSGVTQRGVFWFAAVRNEGAELMAFIDHLYRAWVQHYSSSVARLEVLPSEARPLETLRFAGVTPGLPRISIEEPTGGEQK